MTRNTVLLRADGGPSIGMGHLTRTAGLAEACLQRDYDPELLTRTSPETDLDGIVPRDLDRRTLPAGCSRDEDRRTTVDWIREHDPAFVVTDLCNGRFIPDPDGYRSYLEAVAAPSRFLVTIDDLHTFPMPADLVVNPNYGASDRSYTRDGDTTYLLGPDYFIFRNAFLEQRTENRCDQPDLARNLLVTLGGSDLQNVTGTVCRAVSRLDRELNVHVISGIAAEALPVDPDASSRINWRFSRFVHDFAEVLAGVDLAITAGGLTKYETALLGVPSLVISQVDHQHKIMQSFEDAGTCIYLGRAGDASCSALRQNLSSLMSDRSRRERMAGDGLKLVDGNGRERIFDALADRRSSEPSHPEEPTLDLR